jgi:hypothetical protein
MIFDVTERSGCCSSHPITQCPLGGLRNHHSVRSHSPISILTSVGLETWLMEVASLCTGVVQLVQLAFPAATSESTGKKLLKGKVIFVAENDQE